jgi:hypothetical protein
MGHHRHRLPATARGLERLAACALGMASMSRRPRIVEVVPLDGLELRLTFSDGLVRELEFRSSSPGRRLRGYAGVD